MSVFSVVWRFIDVGTQTSVISVSTREELIDHIARGLRDASAYTECVIVGDDGSEEIVKWRVDEFARDVGEFVTQKFFDSQTAVTVGSHTDPDSYLGRFCLEEEESFLDSVWVTKVMLPADGVESHWSRP